MSRYVLKSKTLDFSSEEFLRVVRPTGVKIIDEIAGHALLIEATEDAAAQLRRVDGDLDLYPETAYPKPTLPRAKIQSRKFQ